jgi:transposase
MGSRVTRAAAHLPAEEVKRRMTRDPRFWCRQRWLIIYQALIAPRKAEDIATHTGASLTTVRRVISTYNRFGVAAVETPGTGGRRHEYLSLEQERAFLQPFFARAAKGEIATVAEIQRAFEAAIQHPVHQSSIYRLLHRHAWRKLAPRSFHPKANPEEQATFKKTSRRPSKPPSPPAPPTISAPC